MERSIYNCTTLSLLGILQAATYTLRLACAGDPVQSSFKLSVSTVEAVADRGPLIGILHLKKRQPNVAAGACGYRARRVPAGEREGPPLPPDHAA